MLMFIEDAIQELEKKTILRERVKLSFDKPGYSDYMWLETDPSSAINLLRLLYSSERNYVDLVYL